MKKCSKCGLEKDITEFHRRGNSYKSSCKTCRKTEESKEAVQSRAKAWYYQFREKARDTRVAYRESHRAEWSKYQIAWRKNHPEHAHAHWTVSNALRQGKIHKQPCENCGSENVHAHHDDYSKPLQVRWLCPQHHSNHHKEAHA